MRNSTRGLPSNLVNEFCAGFYGYGNRNWNAPWWFLGMEERGCADYSQAERRLSVWCDQGKPDLIDLHRFHHGLGIDLTKEKLPTTWRFLIRLMLSATDSKPIANETVLQTLGEQWGTTNGRTCLVELQPLPCPRRGDWLWPSWSGVEGRKTGFERRVLPQRATALAERRRDKKPPVVVFYGSGFNSYWNQIVGRELPKLMEPDVRGGKVDGTVFLSIPHPSSRAKGMSHDLMQRLGSWVRDRLAN